MKKHLTYILLFVLVPFIKTLGQTTTTLIKRDSKFFHEEYYALKSDTSIKQGKYYRQFRDYIIEKGVFKNGEKHGRWVYFSLDGIFDFEYDYNLKKVTKVANKNTPEDYIETPVFFDGSPIIPYVYLISHVNYPVEAQEKNIHGKITLTLDINNEGQITSLSLAKKLHPLLDNEVLKVARTFPLEWKWIPATYNGMNTSGKYNIDVEFELVEEEEQNEI